MTIECFLFGFLVGGGVVAFLMHRDNINREKPQ